MFADVERLLGIGGTGTHQERCTRICEHFVRFWSCDQDDQELKKFVQDVRQTLRICFDEILHPDYAKCSRAQWLCTVSTWARLQLGLTILLRFGERRHINMVLRLAPLSLHLLAAGFWREQTWRGGWAHAMSL